MMSFSIHFKAVRFMLAHTIWEPCLPPFFPSYNFRCLCVLFLKNKVKNKICSMCEVPRCPHRMDWPWISLWGLEPCYPGLQPQHNTWHRSTKKGKMARLIPQEQSFSLNINQAHTYKQNRGKTTWHLQKWFTMDPLNRSALNFLLPRDKLFRHPHLDNIHSEWALVSLNPP